MKKYFLLLLLSASLVTRAQQTVLHCGKLLDVQNRKVLSGVSVFITGNKIMDIQSGYSQPTSGGKVIDLKNKTVMPGLMDMHVHLTGETKKGALADEFITNQADVAFESVKYANITLMAGFTTVRDLGGGWNINNALRNAVNKGQIDGPRIYSAGTAIATTGGHADPTNGYRMDLMGDPGPKEGVANGIVDGRKAVRQRYKEGSDLIKITATGGVLSQAKDGAGAQLRRKKCAPLSKRPRIMALR